MKAILVFCCFLLLLLGGSEPAFAACGAAHAATVTRAKIKRPAMAANDTIDSMSANDIASNAADDDDEGGFYGRRSDAGLFALAACNYNSRFGTIRFCTSASFSGKPRYLGLCSLRI